MIKEDYVSFETAKLLKKKGFNEDSWFHYDANGDIVMRGYRLNMPEDIPAWTLQMAAKWLRENGFIISPIPDFRFNKLLYTNLIINTNSDPQRLASELYNTYEEACEAAIKYCLENLI